jgi:hypothetical protein
MDVDEITARLRSREELRSAGMSRTALEAAVRNKSLVPVHRGWVMAAAFWQELFAEGRSVAWAFAVADAARLGPPVFSHTTAAALWGLPLSRVTVRHAHVIAAKADGTVAGKQLVSRHRADLPEADVAVRHGLRCTSLVRTVCDLVGRLPVEAAIALTDAALREVAWREETREYDEAAAESWRAEALEMVAQRAGSRGAPQARWVLAFADGRAQLPGESISRLYLEQLGFARPRLQVRVAGPEGEDWAMDLGLDDVPAWGEFDGEGKYIDPEMLADRTTTEAVMAEKAREDWVRGSTNRPVLPWGWPHIATAATLGQRLASFHVVAPAPHLRIHFSVPRSTL